MQEAIGEIQALEGRVRSDYSTDPEAKPSSSDYFTISGWECMCIVCVCGGGDGTRLLIVIFTEGIKEFHTKAVSYCLELLPRFWVTFPKYFIFKNKFYLFI